MNERFDGETSPEQESIHDEGHESRERTDRNEQEKDADKQQAEKINEMNADIKESQQELESLYTKNQIDLLKQQIPQPVDTTKHEYEHMSEEEIHMMADQWRNESENNIMNLIESTSRIPDIIKRNL